MAEDVLFTVFTKPWRMPIPALAEHVAGLGFAGVELPVRPGYPVHPGNAATELPRAARALEAVGLRVASVAGAADEATVEACAAAGVPLLRVCLFVGDSEDYLAAEARMRCGIEALVPALERGGVTLGIQNHCGRSVCNAMGLRSLLADLEPRCVAAVWDPAHNALQGEEPELALDIVWPSLRMVNLKNAFWRRATGPEAESVEWTPYWTSGRQGLASWPRVAAQLGRRGYAGPVCLTAEYTDQASVDRLIAEDLRYARALFDAKG